MFWLIIKALISAIVIVAVAEISGRYPKYGALLLSLPFVSMLAFILTWSKQGEMVTICQMARHTLILVPLGFAVLHSVCNRGSHWTFVLAQFHRWLSPRLALSRFVAASQRSFGCTGVKWCKVLHKGLAT